MRIYFPSMQYNHRSPRNNGRHSCLPHVINHNLGVKGGNNNCLTRDLICVKMETKEPPAISVPFFSYAPAAWKFGGY